MALAQEIDKKVLKASSQASSQAVTLIKSTIKSQILGQNKLFNKVQENYLHQLDKIHNLKKLMTTFQDFNSEKLHSMTDNLRAIEDFLLDSNNELKVQMEGINQKLEKVLNPELFADIVKGELMEFKEFMIELQKQQREFMKEEFDKIGTQIKDITPCTHRPHGKKIQTLILRRRRGGEERACSAYSS